MRRTYNLCGPIFPGSVAAMHFQRVMSLSIAKYLLMDRERAISGILRGEMTRTRRLVSDLIEMMSSMAPTTSLRYSYLVQELVCDLVKCLESMLGFWALIHSGDFE